MCLEKEKMRNNLEIKVDDLLEMWYDAVREAEEQDKLLAAYRDDSKNLGNTDKDTRHMTTEWNERTTHTKGCSVKWLVTLFK